MAYPENKSENYTNLGGINTKASQYLTGPNEFLNLQNVDTRTPGALSSFAGFTQFTLSGTSSPITGLMDFFPVGSSYFPVVFGSYAIIATDATAASRITGATFVNIYQYIVGNQVTRFSFVRGLSLYGANQYEFFQYPGSTTALQYGLPKPYSASVNALFQGSTGGLTGTVTVFQALVRNDGLVGPAIGITFSVLGGYTGLVSNVRSINPSAATGVSAGSFGISGMRLWAVLNGSQYYVGVTLMALGASYLLPDTFQGGTTGWSLNPQIPDPEEYFGTFLYGFNTDNGATNSPIPGLQLNPSNIEIYSNQLFSAGFITNPDTVWCSQIGNLEKHDLEASFEVGAGDGDIVTCMKAYFTQLTIFKFNSTWALGGDNADNFFLTQVSSQYGCIAPSGACIWEQKLWFLDKKGICEYNGANTRIISNKVEDYFKRMNLKTAKIQASLVHVKDRNEVWCAIPIDGSSYNNIIIVYDYVADAWSTRTSNRSITAIQPLSFGLSNPVPFFGDASGIVFEFGNSLLTDNGVAFTSVIKSRFHSDMGHSVEKMWRRLYLDAVIPAGTTQNIAVNLYANQGTSPVLSTTMSLSQFQQRLDFGVSAKDLSVELIYNGGQFLKLNGYTLEYRFQRAV